MRLPSSPGIGGRSSPSASRPSLIQFTMRAMWSSSLKSMQPRALDFTQSRGAVLGSTESFPSARLRLKVSKQTDSADLKHPLPFPASYYPANQIRRPGCARRVLPGVPAGARQVAALPQPDLQEFREDDLPASYYPANQIRRYCYPSQAPCKVGSKALPDLSTP